MRSFFPGVVAVLLGLLGSHAVQACGCCGCCRSGGTAAAPAGNSCPNCPQHAASNGPVRYWSSAYGCYLYYDSASRISYYWSEPHRSYYPVRDNPPANAAASAVRDAPPSGGLVTYTTQYYSPNTGNASAPAR